MNDPRDPGLPGSEIVNNFSQEIKRAIAEGIKAGTELVVDKLNKSFFWWSLATIISAMAVGAGATWLVITSQSAPEWIAHHADGTTESCAIKQDTSLPEFTCHYVTPPTIPSR